MADLDRIRGLIQLAGSSNENEARNAAVLACKMIRDGAVILMNEGDERIIPSVDTVWRDAPMREGSLTQDELLSELRDMGVKVGQKPPRRGR